MKKLLLVFVSFFALTLMSGCNNQDSRTVRFDADGSVISGETDTDLNDGSMESHEGGNDSEVLEELMEDEVKMEEATEEEAAAEEKKLMEKGIEEEKASKTNTKTLDKLAVTSLNGAFLETSSNKNIIEGSVSKETHSIKINDYSLKNFIAGQTDWAYTASTNFGTLKSGWNDYVVKTYDKKGDELDSLMFSINYEGVEIAALPSVGANLWVSLLAAMITSFFVLNRRKLIFNK